MNDRLDYLKQFYALLHRLESQLGGSRKLANCSGSMPWPMRGVYFFFEEGEDRTDSGTGPRVVRVGTHALTAHSRSKLWTRLSQHRGTAKSGGGNHRGSIFRLLVGGSLIGREGAACATWDTGSTASAYVRAAEHELECRVSQVIGAMSILWLPVEDALGPDSLRGYVERNAIALLSNQARQPLDTPSAEWLGHYSDRARVKASGLWNQNHVELTCETAFLQKLEALIEAAA